MLSVLRVLNFCLSTKQLQMTFHTEVKEKLNDY